MGSVAVIFMAVCNLNLTVTERFLNRAVIPYLITQKCHYLTRKSFEVNASLSRRHTFTVLQV